MSSPVSDAQYDALIGLLCEGVTETPPFARFLEALRGWLGADGATLLIERQRRDWPGLILSAGGSPDRVARYREVFTQDPFADLPAGQAVTLREHLGEAQFEASPFIRDFMRPHGVLHVLGADVVVPGGIRVRLRASRLLPCEDFGSTEKQRLTPLLPHLERVVALFLRLANAEAELELFEGVLQRLAVATVVVDRDCRILHANPLARELFSEGDSLKSDHGVLKMVNNMAGSKALAQAASEIADAVVAMAAVPPTRVLHCRRGNRAHLGLLIRPVPRSAKLDAPLRGTALVIVVDPDRELAPQPETLAQLYGLTPAEAEVAALMGRGLSLEEASDALGISKHTGRAHLRAIFAKTGATRQSGLVRLLLRSVDEFDSDGVEGAAAR